jgi:hypothetical protein
LCSNIQDERSQLITPHQRPIHTLKASRIEKEKKIKVILLELTILHL